IHHLFADRGLPAVTAALGPPARRARLHGADPGLLAYPSAAPGGYRHRLSVRPAARRARSRPARPACTRLLVAVVRRHGPAPARALVRHVRADPACAAPVPACPGGDAVGQAGGRWRLPGMDLVPGRHCHGAAVAARRHAAARTAAPSGRSRREPADLSAAPLVEVRNPERELRQFRPRLTVATALAITCFGLLGVRLAWLQVHRYADCHAQAED